jgi:hypothetical protein
MLALLAQPATEHPVLSGPHQQSVPNPEYQTMQAHPQSTLPARTFANAHSLRLLVRTVLPGLSCPKAVPAC